MQLVLLSGFVMFRDVYACHKNTKQIVKKKLKAAKPYSL